MALSAYAFCNEKGSLFLCRFTGFSKYQDTFGRGHNRAGNQFKPCPFHFVSRFLYPDSHFLCLGRIVNDHRFVHRIHLLPTSKFLEYVRNATNTVKIYTLNYNRKKSANNLYL